MVSVLLFHVYISEILDSQVAGYSWKSQKVEFGILCLFLLSTHASHLTSLSYFPLSLKWGTYLKDTYRKDIVINAAFPVGFSVTVRTL